ncbi:MAG: VTT domain-containing protein [Desulfobulbaceae bacterium]|nr:VTT domain-containing protein [Desulfobulbaceae bacterium]
MSSIASLPLLFFTMFIQVVVPPLPAELIVISAGKIHGTTLTTIFAGGGLLTGSITVYYLGRFIHSKLERFFQRDKTQQIISRLKKIENALLWVRILPYNPSDIISYGAGIIEINPVKFILISIVTSFTRTFLLALLGEYIVDMKTFFIVGSILICSFLIGSLVAYGKPNKKKA